MTSSRVHALLDAAEAEFAGGGFEGGSLRSIMRDAGADPGAIHYHFGGRRALAEAVLDRVLAPLNARRLEMLTDVASRGRTRLPQLVEALIRPDIESAHRLEAQSPGRARLIGAIYTRPSDFVTAKVAEHFAPVAEAFRPHLQAALPHLTFDVVAWRVRWCLYGTVGSLLADESAPFDRPADDLVDDLVAPLTAALSA